MAPASDARRITSNSAMASPPWRVVGALQPQPEAKARLTRLHRLRHTLRLRLCLRLAPPPPPTHTATAAAENAYAENAVNAKAVNANAADAVDAARAADTTPATTTTTAPTAASTAAAAAAAGTPPAAHAAASAAADVSVNPDSVHVAHVAPDDAVHGCGRPRQWLAALASPALASPALRHCDAAGAAARARVHVWVRLLWLPSVCTVAAVRWSRRLQVELNRRALLTQLTHYVSTHGGAHSQLGDGSRVHARRAAFRARQLEAVACALGDTSLAWRCRAFFAQSCIQRGMRRRANVVLTQCEAHAREARDEKLQIVVSAIRLRLDQAALDKI